MGNSPLYQNHPIPAFIRAIAPRPTPPTAAKLRQDGLNPDAIHQLALNECPYPPAPSVHAAVAAAVAQSNRYPDFNCPELSERIARDTGIPPERIAWGTGSEEILKLIIEIVSAGDSTIVAARPTFVGYPMMYASANARVTHVPLRADGGLDIDAMLGAIDERTGMLIAVVPNNPSGVMPTPAELARLIAATPDHVLLLIDGAYHEFAAHAGGADPLPLLKQRKGLWLTTRTFSKAYALAGLRVGYGLCGSLEIADALRACMGPLHIPILSQVAARAAYDDRAYTQFILNSCAQERGKLLAGLRALGLKPMDSVCNFVSAETPLPGAEVAQALLKRGVLISSWRDPGYERFIRISIGAAEATAAVLEHLAAIFRH
ncbi:MAG: aminotransferase class I/II-fold pyridoxal phosphate-dependent enzyme [Gammaproteobacteria bacterium]